MHTLHIHYADISSSTTHTFNGHFPDETGLAHRHIKLFSINFFFRCKVYFVICILFLDTDIPSNRMQITKYTVHLKNCTPTIFRHSLTKTGRLSTILTGSSLNCPIVVEKSNMGTTTTCISTEAVALLQDSAHPCMLQSRFLVSENTPYLNRDTTTVQTQPC